MSTFIQRIVDTLDEQADWNVTTTVSRKDLILLVDAYHNLLQQQQVKQKVEKETDIEIGSKVLVHYSGRHWFHEVEDIYTPVIGEEYLYKLNGSGLYTKDRFTVCKNHESFSEVGLAIARNLVDRINVGGGEARIDTTWFDYGQKWSWETIVCRNQTLDMDVQLLSPRDFKEINLGTFNRHSELFELAGVKLAKKKKEIDGNYER